MLRAVPYSTDGKCFVFISASASPSTSTSASASVSVSGIVGKKLELPVSRKIDRTTAKVGRSLFPSYSSLLQLLWLRFSTNHCKWLTQNI